jgi:hypothetical protein
LNLQKFNKLCTDKEWTFVNLVFNGYFMNISNLNFFFKYESINIHLYFYIFIINFIFIIYYLLQFLFFLLKKCI